MDNILKRVLVTPQSTTKEALYIETGLLDPETISQKHNIMMDHRMKNGRSKRLKNMATAEEAQLWKEKNPDKIKTMTGITEHDLVGEKYTAKGKVKRRVGNLFKTKIDKEAQTK